jgi:uncharacterized protein (DUF433 family)
MPDLARITLDPDVCHGKPCVRHMRWPVEVVLDLVASGMTIDEIIEDHPELEREDIIACREQAWWSLEDPEACPPGRTQS